VPEPVWWALLGALWRDLGFGDTDDALILEEVAAGLGFAISPEPDPTPTARQRLLDLGPVVPADDPAILFVATVRWRTDPALALAVTPAGLVWGAWAWPDTALDVEVARRLREDLHTRRPPGDRRVVLYSGRDAVLPVGFADRLGGDSFLRRVEDPPRGVTRPDDRAEAQEVPATRGPRLIWSRAAGGEWTLLATDDEILGADDLAAGFQRLRSAFQELQPEVGTRPRWRTKPAGMPPGQALTWLAMVLRRTAELRTGLDWPVIRRRLAGNGTAGQRAILLACGVPPPR